MNHVWIRTPKGYKSMSVPSENLSAFTKGRKWTGHAPSPAGEVVVEYASAIGGGETVDGYGNFR